MFALLTGSVTLPGLSSLLSVRLRWRHFLLECSLLSMMSTVIITSEAVLM